MKEKLEQKQHQKIVIPAKEVVWLDEHEILVNDCLFDIYSFSLQNGVYTFTGLYDDEETRLIEQREKNKEENKLLSRFFNWFQIAYTNYKEDKVGFKIRFKNLCSLKTVSLVCLSPEVPTPPPRYRVQI